MGRAKLAMKRIENNANRQVSLCKRRNGLLKKAYELSVLTDIDIALLIFSPSRFTHFSGKTRMEDVFTRFIELSNHEIESARWHPQGPTTYCDFPNKENLLRTLQQLKCQDNASTQLLASSSVNPDTAENLQQQISTLQQQIQAAEEEIRMYVPDTLEDKSFEELESLENLLSFTLTRVSQRKDYLLANMPPLNPPSSSVLQQINQIKWLPEYEPSPSQMCIPSEPLLPIGNVSSNILYQLRQEEETGEASTWPHRITCHSQEQPSTMVSLSPSIYYPQFQQGIGVAEQMPNMGDQEIMQCEQVEKTITATDSIPDQEDIPNNSSSVVDNVGYM